MLTAKFWACPTDSRRRLICKTSTGRLEDAKLYYSSRDGRYFLFSNMPGLDGTKPDELRVSSDQLVDSTYKYSWDLGSSGNDLGIGLVSRFDEIDWYIEEGWSKIHPNSASKFISHIYPSDAGRTVLFTTGLEDDCIGELFYSLSDMRYYLLSNNSILNGDVPSELREPGSRYNAMDSKCKWRFSYSLQSYISGNNINFTAAFSRFTQFIFGPSSQKSYIFEAKPKEEELILAFKPTDSGRRIKFKYGSTLGEGVVFYDGYHYYLFQDIHDGATPNSIKLIPKGVERDKAMYGFKYSYAVYSGTAREFGSFKEIQFVGTSNVSVKLTTKPNYLTINQDD